MLNQILRNLQFVFFFLLSIQFCNFYSQRVRLPKWYSFLFYVWINHSFLFDLIYSDLSYVLLPNKLSVLKFSIFKNTCQSEGASRGCEEEAVSEYIYAYNIDFEQFIYPSLLGQSLSTGLVSIYWTCS